MSQELQVIEPREYSVEEVVARVNKIHDVMKHAMQKDHHYGVIPGTGQNRPTLLKPGAELLCMMFRLGPKYRVDAKRDGLHIDCWVTCELWHTPTGILQGEGIGCCSTREAKYAYRKAGRACPKCGKEAIIKGKEEYGGGWLCWPKKGGCNSKFSDEEKAITNQSEGRVENPDIPDAYNTVLKMAQKRAMIAAVLNVTAASDIFTQDLEDFSPRHPSTKDDGEILPPSDTNGVPDIADQIDRIESLHHRLEWPDEFSKKILMDKFGVSKVQEMSQEQLDSHEANLTNTLDRRTKQPIKM